MKTVQFYITLALACGSLLLVGLTYRSAQKSKDLQKEMQAQAQKIAQGRRAAQMNQAILADLAKLSLEHPKIKTLLNQHGYKVEFTPDELAQAEEAAEASAATATPAPSPASNRKPSRNRKP